MSLFQPGYLPAQMIAGNVYHASTTFAGVTIPIYSTTASHTFALWNPLGSGILVVPLKLMVGYSSATTPALSTLGLGVIANAGAAAATGAAIPTFTAATVYNGRLGMTKTGKALFALAATSTSAATFAYELGLSQESATPGTGMVKLVHEFDGAFGIEPSTFVTLVGAPLAPGQPLVLTLSYMEIPYTSI